MRNKINSVILITVFLLILIVTHDIVLGNTFHSSLTNVLLVMIWNKVAMIRYKTKEGS